MLKWTPSAQMETYRLPSDERRLHSMCSCSQTAFKRVIVAADSPGASGPRRAWRASEKSLWLYPVRRRMCAMSFHRLGFLLLLEFLEQALQPWEGGRVPVIHFLIDLFDSSEFVARRH